MTNKRSDYITWDETFMHIAFVIAKRSKDPSTQVGACIVNEDNHVVGVGYNGFPRGCSDDDFSWSKVGQDNKYLFVVHADENAILNSYSSSLKNCRIYTTMFPCNKCAQAIIQKGITKIFYAEYKDKHKGSIEYKASRKMLDSANVVYCELKPRN